jgi:Zn-dependent protease
MCVLSLAFSFAFATYPPIYHLNEVIAFLPISFLAIFTAFFCHEIAHKYTGIKYGYWSEFRMYTQGLIFAIFFSIIAGFVFAAPGAVQIFGNPNKDEMGKISLSGPLTNLILGSLFLGIWYFSNNIIGIISISIAYINIFLAFFNLLPFGPFDGAKIFRWRIEIWITMMAICVIFLIFITQPF